MRKKIGECGVDSGQIMIIDPCYINDEWVKGDWSDKGSTYGKCCDITTKKGQAGQLNYKGGHVGLGVVASSGYGDGVYPVYATYNKEGRIMKLEIEF